jgi:hypothetical protein
MKHVPTFKHFINESKSLLVYPSSKKDHQMISNWLEKSDFHAEEEKNYFSFSVADQKDADKTETALDKEFSKLGADARFVLESRVNEASVQIAGHGKPSGAKVLATVIFNLLNDDADMNLNPNRNKKKDAQLIGKIAELIMDSTF